MDLLGKGGYNLKNLGKVNIILGKNGCGKSTALKEIDKALENNDGLNKYLSPERGGHLKHNPSLENQVSQNGTSWFSQQLRNNQYSQFKQQSVLQYRNLETITLREIEKNTELRADHSYTFDSVVEKINRLLGNIEIKREDSDFEIFLKETEEQIDSKKISSGESELISLAIECLYFEKQSKEDEINVLLIDEPDVHLHPDLQVRFAKFIQELVENGSFIVLIATHSTALLGGFYDFEEARFDFMQNNQTDFDFKQVNEVYSRILPIFGAHPLSNLFNEAPILLVEGEDDVRIWQQAVRSSNNRLKIYPCSVDTIDNLSMYEDEVAEILNAVYDNAKGFSLRDRDEEPEEIDDKLPVTRFRLSCRNAENLIVTDEVLNNLSTTWEELNERIETWIESNSTHPKFEYMKSFKDEGYLRKSHQLKEIRNDLIGLSNSNKPWEVAVGQTIGKMASGEINIDFSDNKLANFLGEKLVNNLIQV